MTKATRFAGRNCPFLMFIGLRDIGMKRETQFFDYMWNLQDGLKTVIKIMQADFLPYLDISNYELINTHKILNWDYFNVNKHYPELVLMHYDTRVNDVFESVCRKAIRTRDLFYDTSFKIFVYYRAYYKGVETVHLLKEESEMFVEEYSNRYNDNFALVSLIEIPKEESHNSQKIIECL